MSETWRHEDLQADLAAWLKGKDRMVWQDVQLGPVGSMRPDVYTLRKSFIRPQPEAYDVKISRSDFLADATAGKVRKYQDVAAAVWYACPAGLVQCEEIPVGMGLIVRGPVGWRPMRRPMPGDGAPDSDTWMKLLMECHETMASTQRFYRGHALAARQEALRKLGGIVAAYVRNRDEALTELKELQTETEAARETSQKRQQLAVQMATRELKPKKMPCEPFACDCERH